LPPINADYRPYRDRIDHCKKEKKRRKKRESNARTERTFSVFVLLSFSFFFLFSFSVSPHREVTRVSFARALFHFVFLFFVCSKNCGENYKDEMN
jgi:Ca2+/Na+ antiporter